MITAHLCPATSGDTVILHFVLLYMVQYMYGIDMDYGVTGGRTKLATSCSC